MSSDKYSPELADYIFQCMKDGMIDEDPNTFAPEEYFEKARVIVGSRPGNWEKEFNAAVKAKKGWDNLPLNRALREENTSDMDQDSETLPEAL